MSKPKLNQPDVETFTTTCTSCNKYPLKNHKLKFEEFIYRSEVANEKLGNMSAEECQKLFGIKPTEPTLEEVKKEWGDDGWEWKEGSVYIELIKNNEDYNIEISIDKIDKTYCCFEDDDCDQTSLRITFEEHIRLTKTFRALGWFDE